MKYRDLRDFISQLETKNELKEITQEVDPHLEITEISDRVLRAAGPALLFSKPKGHQIPVLANLFGTTKRVALAMGVEDTTELREIGKLLALLKQPDPPRSMRDAWQKLPLFKQIMNMAPKTITYAPCQQQIWQKSDVDLRALPIQTCWPEDAGPLITWGLVTTKNVNNERLNQGIYRQQVIGRNKVIMRWLAQRGGALDYQLWLQKHPKTPFPIAVTLGADPATILAAVTPIPDNISEYAFSGLLRGSRSELVKCQIHDLLVPAHAEIVLEGYIYPNEVAAEGPFGDHTGYYNEIEHFPVFTIECITQRENPIYHSTYTGRPPDEPAILGAALNEVFIPILQKQFPEIIDFYLPPEGCSYRMAIVSMKKKYPGHAKRVMLGIWSFLQQFMYTKFIIVTDDDIDIRNWPDVVWCMTTRMDPKRDSVIIENTPIDYLDFASPESGLGSKIGFDATHKWPAETKREWGRSITMTDEVKRHIDSIWNDLNIF